MQQRGRLATLLLALASFLLVAAPACADAGGGLRILLTNDDGFDAPGITVLKAALEARGHEITMVAPLKNRSGSSVSISTEGRVGVRQQGPHTFIVDGTPADCVRVALTTLLDEPPDLVVSGLNFGQNVGAGTVSSGTVGAALSAAFLGVPAVAVSQAVDPVDVRNTLRYFPDAAHFAAELVDTLASRADGRLLPEGIVLNVNHPPRRRAELAGVQLTRQGRSTLYVVVYERGEDGNLTAGFAPNPQKETVPDADTTALAAGYVSITPLDGSWNVSEESLAELRRLTEALRALTPGRKAASVEVPR